MEILREFDFEGNFKGWQNRTIILFQWLNRLPYWFFIFSFSVILTKKDTGKPCQHLEKEAPDSTEHVAMQTDVKFADDISVFQLPFTGLQFSE